MNSSTISQYRFTWKTGNHFKLLIDGEQFFPAMLGAVQRAKHFVLLETYLFSSGRVANEFISVLSGAVQRGVTVAVMLDDFGAMELSHRDREQLVGAGVKLAFYNPLSFKKRRRNLVRDHRKMLIADGQVAFVGGSGIADEFDAISHPQSHWRDTLLEITGPNVADWQTLFLETWQRWGSDTLSLPVPKGEPTKSDQLGRVMVSRAPIRTEAKRDLVKRIRAARHRVWLTTAYFAPSWKLRRALRRAAKKGVDVRLLLPGPLIDHAWVRRVGHREYARLLHYGIRIFEYQPRFLHSKIHICDDWVMLGSSNMDRWNLRWNLEADQAIYDAGFAVAAAEMIETDFNSSLEINAKAWQQRPWRQQLSEWFWGKMARSLEYISRG